ncbi:predicted protein [Naegleria gruberi]|uniref:Predicted protein n=1 Tax=Naegleria gruberi TaxID=5762 RepID=D2VUX3_NAEGR|nr:uncharacterized protein NAEGRDRAFT_72817 [Naegleria gruberi]EFC39394.1 predicted protein [Naegleria gruberi]|eukprot:XP_002672138.1 predicted protein [Naegleria gruberi strain NEG-M]
MPINPSMLKKENYHRETYRNIFDMFDSDMDGLLDEHDLMLVFTKLGRTTETNGKEISDLINDLNSSSDKNGITFDQFVELIGESEDESKGNKLLSFLTSKKSKKVAGMHTENDLKEAFNLFDENKDGEITKQEFRSMIYKLQGLGNISESAPGNVSMSDAEIDYLFSIVDTANKGALNFEQFVSLFTKSMI